MHAWTDHEQCNTSSPPSKWDADQPSRVTKLWPAKTLGRTTVYNAVNDQSSIHQVASTLNSSDTVLHGSSSVWLYHICIRFCPHQRSKAHAGCGMVWGVGMKWRQEGGASSGLALGIMVRWSCGDQPFLRIGSIVLVLLAHFLIWTCGWSLRPIALAFVDWANYPMGQPSPSLDCLYISTLWDLQEIVNACWLLC